MFTIMKRLVIVGAMLLSAIMVLAQTQVQRETLSVQGYQGQATVIRNHGRVFVDVQDLARITKGSLSFEEDRIILTLAPSDASEAARNTATKSGFSPRVHEGRDRGDGLDKRMGRDAAGDRSKWISRGEGHGRKHDSRVPGSSRRQRRISLRHCIYGR